MSPKTRQAGLPMEAADLLRGSYARDDGFVHLSGVVRALTSKGWTLRVISEVLGVSVERVRQYRDMWPTSTFREEVPSPPPSRAPKPPKPPRPTLTDEERKYIRENAQTAASIRRDSSADDRRIGEEFTRILANAKDRGVTYAELGEAACVQPDTIRFRLARHGYRKRAPSVKPYTYRTTHSDKNEGA